MLTNLCAETIKPVFEGDHHFVTSIENAMAFHGTVLFAPGDRIAPRPGNQVEAQPGNCGLFSLLLSWRVFFCCIRIETAFPYLLCFHSLRGEEAKATPCGPSYDVTFLSGGVTYVTVSRTATPTSWGVYGTAHALGAYSFRLR